MLPVTDDVVRLCQYLKTAIEHLKRASDNDCQHDLSISNDTEWKMYSVKLNAANQHGKFEIPVI